MTKSSFAKMAILSAILIVLNSCTTAIHRCYDEELRPEAEIAKIKLMGAESYTVNGETCRSIKEALSPTPEFYKIELLPGTYTIQWKIHRKWASNWSGIRSTACKVTVEAGRLYYLKAGVKSTGYRTAKWECRFSRVEGIWTGCW